MLITGAAGRIGVVLTDGLYERYQLRVLYNRTILDQKYDEEVMVANITDLEKMEEAVDGMDAVVHMAGNPSGGATFEETVEANIIGTYNIYEACKRRGVKRVIFASTNHVTGMTRRRGYLLRPGKCLCVPIVITVRPKRMAKLGSVLCR